MIRFFFISLFTISKPSFLLFHRKFLIIYSRSEKEYKLKATLKTYNDARTCEITRHFHEDLSNFRRQPAGYILNFYNKCGQNLRGQKASSLMLHYISWQSFCNFTKFFEIYAKLRVSMKLTLRKRAENHYACMSITGCQTVLIGA